MTANDDITKEHKIEDLVDVLAEENNGDPETTESVDNDQLEVSTNDVDNNYKAAFGKDPDGKTIAEAVTEDEEAIEKDLTEE